MIVKIKVYIVFSLIKVWKYKIYIVSLHHNNKYIKV